MHRVPDYHLDANGGGEVKDYVSLTYETIHDGFVHDSVCHDTKAAIVAFIFE
jgi:hypothetical protein